MVGEPVSLCKKFWISECAQLRMNLMRKRILHTKAQSDVQQRLKNAELRPTKQRVQLGALLWGGSCDGMEDCCHVTAEELHKVAKENGVQVSLATVYNTLHQFTAAGLLREIVVGRGRSYFDTNVNPHHHFLYEESGELVDIPTDALQINRLPKAPDGMHVADVDVVVRVRTSA